MYRGNYEANDESPLEFSGHVLVNQTLIVGPEGFNIGHFRRFRVQVVTAVND